MNSLSELLEMHNAAKAKFQEEGKKLLKKEFEKFFAENPRIDKISWRQYTPYFNDGDACHFAVYHPYMHIDPALMPKSAALDGFDEDEDNMCRVCIYEAEELEFVKEGKALNKLWRDVEECKDIMLELFGDHVSVIASTKGGFITDRIDHD